MVQFLVIAIVVVHAKIQSSKLTKSMIYSTTDLSHFQMLNRIPLLPHFVTLIIHLWLYACCSTSISDFSESLHMQNRWESWKLRNCNQLLPRQGCHCPPCKIASAEWCDRGMQHSAVTVVLEICQSLFRALQTDLSYFLAGCRFVVVVKLFAVVAVVNSSR